MMQQGLKPEESQQSQEVHALHYIPALYHAPQINFSSSDTFLCLKNSEHVIHIHTVDKTDIQFTTLAASNLAVGCG
jgi:hypothetical protein